MTKSGNRKRKKLSSSSSTEAASSAEGKGDEAFELACVAGGTRERASARRRSRHKAREGFRERRSRE